MHRFLFGAALAGVALLAGAQDYPSRTITIVAPYGAGSPTEQEGRKLGAHFERVFKKPVIVENRPGAGASLGAAYVAKAAPDGHTLLYIGAAISTFRVLVRDLSFDPLKDLAPVSLVASFTSFFATGQQTPYRTIEDFIADARANPGKLNYGSAGRNTTMLKQEALNRQIGIRVTEIPYAGEAQYLAALIRNDVQMTGASMTGARGQIDAGLVRPLLILGDRRHPLYPNVPSTGEKGWFVPDNGWNGLFAPGTTPRAIVDLLAAEAGRYAASPEVRKRGLEAGVDYIGTPTDQFRKRIEAEAKAWSDVASAVGLKPE